MPGSPTPSSDLAAELLSWCNEGDGIEGLKERGLPSEVIDLVRERYDLERQINRLEDEQGRVWKELIAAVEAL